MLHWDEMVAEFRAPPLLPSEARREAWRHVCTAHDPPTCLVLLTGDGHLPEEDLHRHPPPKSAFWPHLLLSNLQKGVRRQRQDVIAPTAWQLFLQGEAALLLRRLPIVAVEDAAPLVDASMNAVAVWLAIAASYKCPAALHTTRAAAWAAGYAVALAGVDVTTFPPPREVVAGAAPMDGVTRRCLSLRALFGGMRGDMAMLDTVAKAPGSVVGRLVAAPAAFVSFVPEVHALRRAADFHCTDVLEGLAAAHPASKAFHKDAVWVFSSSKNRRRPDEEAPPALAAAWRVIRANLADLQIAAWARAESAFKPPEKCRQTRLSAWMVKKPAMK